MVHCVNHSFSEEQTDLTLTLRLWSLCLKSVCFIISTHLILPYDTVGLMLKKRNKFSPLLTHSLFAGSGREMSQDFQISCPLEVATTDRSKWTWMYIPDVWKSTNLQHQHLRVELGQRSVPTTKKNPKTINPNIPHTVLPSTNDLLRTTCQCRDLHQFR